MKEEDMKPVTDQSSKEEKMDDDYSEEISHHENLIKDLKAITEDVPSVKRRVKALKKLQHQHVKLEVEFYKKIHFLECEFNQKYKPLYAQRKRIITGEYEPSDAECDWPSDIEEELTEEVKTKIQLEPDTIQKENIVGIPGFWLTIFRNVDLLVDMMQIHDEPILICLTDIEVELSEEPMNFSLKFHFRPNAHFTNSVLTKTYDMRCKPDDQMPLSFGGPVIYRCQGCKIDWKTGCDVTVRTICKKQKHRSRGDVRIVTKTEKVESFFNFFSPPLIPDDPKAEIDEATQSLLTNDFEIGNLLRERIVPQAIRYYTGEALLDEEEEEEEEDAEYEDEDITSEDHDGDDKEEEQVDWPQAEPVSSAHNGITRHQSLHQGIEDLVNEMLHL